MECVDDLVPEEVHIKVAYGPLPSEKPDVVYLLSLDFGDHAWDDNAWVAELRHLVKADPGDGKRVPYDLSVRKSYLSWGADSASAEIFLYIADHFVGGALEGAAGWAAVKTLGNLRRLAGLSRTETFTEPVKNLVSYGEWHVCAAYGLSDGTTLELIEEGQASDEWTGWFRDPEGYEYGVTLCPSEGHPYRVRVARRAPGQGRSLPPLLGPKHDAIAPRFRRRHPPVQLQPAEPSSSATTTSVGVSTATTAPGVVSGVTVAFPKERIAVLSWSAPAGATAYQVRISKTNATKKYSPWKPISSSEATFTKLKKKATYRVQIIPTGPGGTGATTTCKFKQKT